MLLFGVATAFSFLGMPVHLAITNLPAVHDCNELSVPLRRRSDLLLHKREPVICWVAFDSILFYFIFQETSVGTSYLNCNAGVGEAHGGDEPSLFNFNYFMEPK